MILQPVRSGGGASLTALAECLPTDTVGDAVYVRAPRTGSRYKVAKCDPADPTKMPTLGIIVQKEVGGTNCVVQFGGPASGVYSGIEPGRRYFVGPDGRPKLPEEFTHPGPGQKHKVQTLGLGLDTGVLLVRPSLDMITHVGE